MIADISLKLLYEKVESFEAPLLVEGIREPNRPFTGTFIRAPVTNLSTDCVFLVIHLPTLPVRLLPP